VWVDRLAAAAAREVPFSVHVWRRGTVPIWWGAEIKSSIQDAEIFVQPRQPLAHSSAYFRRLARRYAEAWQAPPGGADSSAAACPGSSGSVPRGASVNGESEGETGSAGSVSVFCVDLLRVGLGRSELPLTEKFQEMVARVNSQAQGHTRAEGNRSSSEAARSRGKAAPEGSAGGGAVDGPGPSVEYVSLDWHATTKAEGEHGAVEGRYGSSCRGRCRTWG